MIVWKIRVSIEVHVESIDWLAAFASASATMPTASTVAALSMLTVAMTTADAKCNRITILGCLLSNAR